MMNELSKNGTGEGGWRSALKVVEGKFSGREDQGGGDFLASMRKLLGVFLSFPFDLFGLLLMFTPFSFFCFFLSP